MLCTVTLLGIDFNSATQTVTITAGTNSSMMNIPVTDDNIVEGDETFSMSVTVPSSLGPGITTGTITNATITIIDTSSEYHYYYVAVLCIKCCDMYIFQVLQ